jgi:type IV fimbrial biogenesis protein FimT
MAGRCLVKKSFSEAVKGFTLVELMIVVVLLAVLILLGIPSFQNFIAKRNLRNVAESVYYGLQVARANAVKTNHPTVFYLDSSGRKWIVDELMPGTPDENGNTTYSVADASTQGGTHLQTYEWNSEHPEIDASLNVGAKGQKVTGGTYVTFDSLGRVMQKNISAGAVYDNPTPLALVTISNSVKTNINKLEVEINLSNGQGIRVCSPFLPETDPKGCIEAPTANPSSNP